MNLLIINPHLSTGGCPQYLYEFILHNKDKYETLKVVEFSNFSDEYVVQKNKIKKLIGEQNVISLGDFWEEDIIFQSKKYNLLNIIQQFNPDVIWFNEFPECFEYKLPPEALMKKIYSADRSYKIIETTHNNSFDFNNKVFIPDEFMFCSELHLEKSKNINVKKYIWEVPIKNQERPDRESTLKYLNLDPSFLHVLNVGIFNQNKNQKYIFDLAEKLKLHKIQFHFVGNTCFLNDCSIEQNQLLLNNCKIWGERSDVDVFMSCMDIFLFPSCNELNPLSVKEALSWNMDVLCKKCDNYTEKYSKTSNFYLLENIDVSDFILNKLKDLKQIELKKSEKIKFGLYTSFYNAERFIDYIFNEVSKINHDNWEWIITDDFSKDNTKSLLLEKVKNFKNVRYVEQSHKKEMYWQPNKFFDSSFDYIVLIDCDDGFDYNFLKIYGNLISKYPDAVLITSDFVKTKNDSLQSLSLVKNDETILEKLKTFHPETDYLKNLSYNTLGHLRCFKNIKNLNFEISDFDACAEDSYRVMYMNSIGKWLHIPRCLYDWKLRSDSESHSVVKSNFNGNFDLAYNKIKNNCYYPYFDFDDVYEITSAISRLGINQISGKTICIFSENLNLDQKNKLRLVYSDCKLIFNKNEKSDFYIFIYNACKHMQFMKSLFSDIKAKSSESKIIIYYFEKRYFDNKDDMDREINQNIEHLKEKLDGFFYIYFLYFRHNYFIL